VIRSTDKDKVQQATDLVNAKIKEAERLAYVLELDASDSWILPVIIGKNGNQVSSLRAKHPSCKIDVSKDTRTITVVGDSEDAVQKVREAILEAVEKARSENAFVMVPESSVPQFVGKGGAHVKEMSASLGVDIQRVRKGQYNFKISGEASKVLAAKKAVDDWLVKREKAMEVLTLKLEREKDIAVILGEKGTVARSLQEDYKCKIDIDKTTLVLTVKGETEETRNVAMSKIQELLLEEREKIAARRAAAKQEDKMSLSAETSQDAVVGKTEEPVSRNRPSNTNSQSNSRNAPSRTHSHDKKGSQKSPLQPIGLAASKDLEGKINKENVIDPSIDEGTEAGKSLFAMLLADD